MSNIKHSILLIEGDVKLRNLICKTIELENFDIFETDTIKRGIIDSITRKPDLVIVDLGLPDGNGVEFLKEVRGWSDVPVIVLSGSNRESEKMAAFNAGADDYITIPFRIDELVARIKSQLRKNIRQSFHSDAAGEILHGDIKIDFLRKTVTKSGRHIQLTPKEYRLLTILANNPNCVLTHGQLLSYVWGPTHSEQIQYLRVFMRHIRKKIENNPDSPQYILTRPGIGYMFATGLPHSK